MNTKQLIEDAAQAQELYGDDELEEFVAKLKAQGKTPQIKPGEATDLAELIED